MKQPPGLSIILGSARLKPCESGSTALTELFSYLNQLQAKNKKTQEEVATQVANIDTLKRVISENENAHKEWEAVVFTRFKDVLNAKKRKIRELQKMIATGGQPAQHVEEAEESVTEISASDGDETELDE